MDEKMSTKASADTALQEVADAVFTVAPSGAQHLVGAFVHALVASIRR
jgi:hypothetical protein